MQEKINKILNDCIIADMHSDIPMHVYQRRKNGERKVIENNYYEDIKNGHVNIIVGVIYLLESQLDNPVKNGLEQLMAFKEDIEESKDKLAYCTSYEEIQYALKNDKIAFIPAFEGMEPIDDSLEVLKAFYDLGVRFCGMTWSRTNKISDGCGYGEFETEEKKGLSDFGKTAVKKAEDLGMVIDFTHISEKGFWDALEFIKKPSIASHTNARGVHNIVRNFTDSQLEALKNIDAVIGVSGVSDFVGYRKNSVPPDMCDYVNHIDYIKDKIGMRHIGMGLDLYPYFYNSTNYELPHQNGERPVDIISCYSHLPALLEEMIKRQYTQEEIEMFLGKNLMRIIKERL